MNSSLAEPSITEITRHLVNVLADDFDHPEIWIALRQSADADGDSALLPLLQACNLAADNEHSRPSIALALKVICAMTVAVLGQPEFALAELADLQLTRSQSALVAGAIFYVESLLHAEDERYQLMGKVCMTPFVQLDCLEESTHQCCASWLQRSAGNLKKTPWRDVWNSEAARQIRGSVLDGSYRYCNKSLCPTIQGGLLIQKAELRQRSEFWRDVIDNNRTELDRGPEVVNLAYDRTCNLSCPSCRTGKITAANAQREVLLEMQERNVLPMLRTAGTAVVTGSGDPFASKIFRQLLQSLNAREFPQLKLQIMTNGMLLTPPEWAKFPGIHGRVGKLKVSIDAAAKATHESLRRGANWDIMLENLRFIGDIRAKGEIEMFELVFVVQRENFREMGAAVELAHRVGADQIYFARLSNWGTFSTEEFRRTAVFATSHPEHAAFLDAMRDSRLRDPIAYLPDLLCFLPREAHAGAVELQPEVLDAVNGW